MVYQNGEVKGPRYIRMGKWRGLGISEWGSGVALVYQNGEVDGTWYKEHILFWFSYVRNHGIGRDDLAYNRQNMMTDKK